MQDVLRSSLESSFIPAFEMSCKAMFEQVDAAFQKGMVEHTTATQQQFDATHSPLAHALRVCISTSLIKAIFLRVSVMFGFFESQIYCFYSILDHV